MSSCSGSVYRNPGADNHAAGFANDRAAKMAFGEVSATAKPHQPAVDGDGLAGDKRRVLRAQKPHLAGCLSALAEQLTAIGIGAASAPPGRERTALAMSRGRPYRPTGSVSQRKEPKIGRSVDQLLSFHGGMDAAKNTKRKNMALSKQQETCCANALPQSIRCGWICVNSAYTGLRSSLSHPVRPEGRRRCPRARCT